MPEAQELELLWSPEAVSLPCEDSEAPKENAPSFLLGQLQSELCEALLHLLLEAVHVLPVLETHHEVISETHQISFATTPRLDLLLKPQVEDKVEIEVTEHGRDRTTLWS